MCSLEKRGRVYLLTLTGEGEHRINPSLCVSVLSALAQIRSDPSSCRGHALVLAAEGKYFSNGLDLDWANQSPSDHIPLLHSSFIQTMEALAFLPMPTVAAITGHASAGGFILALTFDYRVMRSDRGVLYMSELDIGLPIPSALMQVIRSKVPCPGAAARVLLGAEKLTAREALAMGIVDRTAGCAREAVAAAVAMAEEIAERDWKGEVYASIRAATFPAMAQGLGLMRSRM